MTPKTALDAAIDMESACFQPEQGMVKSHALTTEKSRGANASGVEDVLSRALYEPLEEFLKRPSKNVRAQLVKVGFHLAGERLEREFRDRNEVEVCRSLAQALESIHAGSLVIDDIQDGSKERRGAPALHERYGMPLALNAGNWLYFRPFGTIRDLELNEKTELLLYRLFHETMFDAHLGQAIDLGTRIDEIEQERASALCMSSLRLKTGALTSLAIGFGAIAGFASEKRLSALREFGMALGTALQMFDDIGNLCLPAGSPKRFEDLQLRRPTWIWAAAAEEVSALEYHSFIEAVRHLPHETPLKSWLKATGFVERARDRANVFLRTSMDQLNEQVGTKNEYPRAFEIINELSERIRISYG